MYLCLHAGAWEIECAEAYVAVYDVDFWGGVGVGVLGYWGEFVSSCGDGSVFFREVNFV